MANEFIIKNGFKSQGPSEMTGSLTVTGSSSFVGNQIVTGSNRSNVTALAISSNTASLDFSLGNFFTLQLVTGTNTFISMSNIRAGQTSIVEVSTIGSATVTFPSSVKQPSASIYVPTTTTSKDLLTLASLSPSSVYVVSVKDLL